MHSIPSFDTKFYPSVQNRSTLQFIYQLPQQTSSNQQSLNGKQPANNRQPWTEKVFAGKTLWDWMSLLLVPLLVGIGTILVTAQQTSAQNALSQQLHNADQHQHDNDQYIAQQARYDELLKNYRDGIDTLLLTNGLRTAPLVGPDIFTPVFRRMKSF